MRFTTPPLPKSKCSTSLCFEESTFWIILEDSQTNFQNYTLTSQGYSLPLTLCVCLQFCMMVLIFSNVEWFMNTSV